MTGSTGPGRLAPTGAALAFASLLPSSSGEPVIPIRLARVRLFRLPGEVPERAILDTVLPFSDGDTTRTMTVGLTLTMVSERFGIELSLIDDRAQVVYLARDTVVAYTTNEPPVSKAIKLRYAGPDTLVTRVALAPGDTSLSIGDAVPLRAVAYLKDGTPTKARFGFVVHGTSAIVVDQEGNLRAVSPVARGTAWVVARLATGLADSVAVGAVVPAKSLDLTAAQGEVEVGGQFRLGAVVRDSTGAELPGRLLTWTSSDISLATVVDGVVLGKGVGKVTITARSERASSQAVITVVPTRVVRVVPSVGTVTVVAGATAPISASALDAVGQLLPGRVALWSSRDQRIAVIPPVGDPSTTSLLVRGVSAGTTTLDVVVEGARATVEVVVKPKPAGRVTIVPDALSLLMTETFLAAAAVRDSSGNVLSGRTVVWRSLAPSIVGVDPDGTLTARATGRADVEASVDGAADTLSVLVRRISKLTIVPLSSVRDDRGEVVTFGLEALDQNGAVIDEQSAEWTIVGGARLLDTRGPKARVLLHGEAPSTLTASVLNEEAHLVIPGVSVPETPPTPPTHPVHSGP